MYEDPQAGNRLRHDSHDPNAWGEEMLVYLRDHDADFERWRHEQLARLDADYCDFRRERFHGEFSRWRAQRRGDVNQQQRTGRVDEDAGLPAIGMPLRANEMPAGGATIEPDAGAAQRRAAVEAFHANSGSARQQPAR